MTSASLSPARIEQTARHIWLLRENNFPAFVRQTWEQGTALARATTLSQAENVLRGRKPSLRVA